MNDSDSKGRATGEIKVRGHSDVKGYVGSNDTDSDQVKSNPQPDLEYTPNEKFKDGKDSEKQELGPSINNNNTIEVKEKENIDSPVK